MRLAYIDACVWITLIEGLDRYRPQIRATLSGLSQEGWAFCTSDAVCLEVLVGPLRSRDEALADIYRTLLGQNHRLVVPRTVFADALRLATSEGLKAMDAVHCAIASHNGCGRFVTTDPHFRRLKTIRPVLIALHDD